MSAAAITKLRFRIADLKRLIRYIVSQSTAQGNLVAGATYSHARGGLNTFLEAFGMAAFAGQASIPAVPVSNHCRPFASLLVIPGSGLTAIYPAADIRCAQNLPESSRSSD